MPDAVEDIACRIGTPAKGYLKPAYLFLFMFFVAMACTGQHPVWKKPRYLAIIEDKSEKFVLSGALYSVTDSFLLLTCSSCKAQETEQFQIRISYLKIDEITIRKNTRFNNWLISGALTGALSMAYAFLMHRETPDGLSYPAPVYYAAYAVAGAFPFILTGSVRSLLIEKRVAVLKSFSLFTENRALLNEYCFRP